MIDLTISIAPDENGKENLHISAPDMTEMEAIGVLHVALEYFTDVILGKTPRNKETEEKTND